MELEWGDVPLWVSTGLALGGVAYGAWNLRIIRKDNREQLEVQIEEQKTLTQERREQQARLVWWVSTGEESERDGHRFSLIEVHNDSDRPIFIPIVRSEVREELLTSSTVDVVMPHSAVSLETEAPPRPIGWNEERTRLWLRVRRGRRLYFQDARGRAWECLGRGDARQDEDVLREVTDELVRNKWLRRQTRDLNKAVPKGILRSLPSYGDIEAELLKKPWMASDVHSAAQLHVQQEALAIGVIEALQHSPTAPLMNKVFMVHDHLLSGRLFDGERWGSAQTAI